MANEQVNQNSQENKPLEKKDTMTRKKNYQFFINNCQLNNDTYKHKSNKVNTTKYNIFIFLPMALLFQFMRLANVYFLIIAIIQSIPAISPLSSSTAVAPLAFVLAVSLIREGFEDWARYQYDKVLNSEPVTVFRNRGWIESDSGNLQLGELVIVKEDGVFPADLIILDSNLPEGTAFIETGTLDGEKTLKAKISSKETAGYFNNGGTWKNNFDFEGKCLCDAPNFELYVLNGSMDLTFKDAADGKTVKIGLDAKQIMYKGALLRNTKWIIGYVVYAGHNTKLILNSKKPRMKFSRIELLMSKLLIAILILQSIFCIILAGIYQVYYYANIQMSPYQPGQINGVLVDSVLTYFTYLLLLNTMIPISLIITLEIVKMIQGYFISVDVEGFSTIRQKFIKAASVSLNEELGQVNYIFSDKTGTLTCNKMVFKFCVIGDVCYEYVRDYDAKGRVNESNDEAHMLRQEMDIIPFPHKFMLNLARSRSTAVNRTRYPNFEISSENKSASINLEAESALVEEYWKALSLCHECTVEEKENGAEDYSGMSPDDIELVRTAAMQGFKMTKSHSTIIRKISIGEEERNFNLLHILEFNSDRKRASVIVKDGDVYKLYMKGADNKVQELLDPNPNFQFKEQAMRYVNHFSSKGFRTLLVAMKVLDEKEYLEWARKLNEAGMLIEGKKEEVERCYKEIETGCTLIGATIVEDRLQDLVPETIRDLRLAGIKIWMCTGDKLDTAFNIGLSCNLINKDLKTFRVSGEAGESVNKKLVDEYHQFINQVGNAAPFAILIDSVAICNVLKDTDNIKTFLDIACGAVAVMCCRVTPLEKSEIVRIVKVYDNKAVTLAVGDGGNDVSMILEAHIGIGVYGEEGMRAVQSGDYAIGEFKFLRRLLLFHGRVNNIRVSEMILYFFYKNFVFTLNHFFFAFYNNCSGQTIIDDWFIALYNLIFTAFPLGVRACADFDVKPDDGQIVYEMMPFLYKENRDKPIFSVQSFLLALFRGIVHGLINFLFLVYTLGVSSVDLQGNMADIWFFSIVSIRMILGTKYNTFINWLIMGVLTFLTYIAFLIWVNYSSLFKSVATMTIAFAAGKYWFNTVLIVGTCAAIDFATNSFHVLFGNNLKGELMVLVKERGTLNNRLDDFPQLVEECYKVYDSVNTKKELQNVVVNKEGYRIVNEENIEQIDRVDRKDKVLKIVKS